MDATLKSRMLKAAAWLVGANLSTQVLRLGSNLVLTRLLMPEAFGLVAAVNTLYFALVMFSDLGVWQSVVNSRHGHEARFQGTAWSVQLARAVLLALVVLVLALVLHLMAARGVFASDTVYADARLPAMISLFALCAVVQGLESIKLATAQRELHGGHLARLELASQLGAMVSTIGLALATHSVWSLTIGTVIGAVVRTVLSHVYLPGHSAPPCWDRAYAHEIIHFGKWIFVSSIIGFLAAHGEKIILGGTLGTASFGIYSIASTMLAAIVGVYGTLNGHVIFPSLSLALRSGDSHEVVRVYTRVQQLSDLLLGVLTGVLLMSGQWIIWVLYDPRYREAGVMLQMLGVGLLATRQQVVEQLMFARAQPAWVSGNNALRALGLFVCVPAGYALGGEHGAVMGVVIAQFAGWPLSLTFKYRQGLLVLATEKWWLPALLGGCALGWVLDRAMSALLH